MAHATKISQAAAKAALDATNDLLGTGSLLKIYNDGAATPATVDTAVPGGSTLLATITLPNSTHGPFGAATTASPSVATAAAISDGTVSVTGTAQWFRITTSGGTAVWQGVCGTSGADLNLATLSLVAAATIPVSSLTASFPTS